MKVAPSGSNVSLVAKENYKYKGVKPHPSDCPNPLKLFPKAAYPVMTVFPIFYTGSLTSSLVFHDKHRIAQNLYACKFSSIFVI